MSFTCEGTILKYMTENFHRYIRN